MRIEEIRICDNVLRVYYETAKTGNGKIIFDTDVKSQLGISTEEFRMAITYLQNVDYIEAASKQHYEITKIGFKFFSHNTIESSLEPKTPSHKQIIIGENNGIINTGNAGNQTITKNETPEKENKLFWKNPFVIWIGSIIGGLIVAYIVYSLKWN